MQTVTGRTAGYQCDLNLAALSGKQKSKLARDRDKWRCVIINRVAWPGVRTWCEGLMSADTCQPFLNLAQHYVTVSGILNVAMTTIIISR